MSITGKTTPPPEIDLGRGSRRNKQIAAIVGAVVVVAVVAVIVVKATSGDSKKNAGGSQFGTTWKIAYQASSASEQEFLQYLNDKVAPKYGVTIRGAGIEDGNQLDRATADGTYIANIYQHKHWLKQVTDSTGMKLTALGPVFQWAYSAWSKKYPSLDALPHGATIALLNDPANTAQALWILQRAGKITFKAGVDPAEATEQDIASNPNGWKFKYVEYGSGPRVLDSVDAVVDYNMSFVDANTPTKYKIYAPPAPLDFAGQLVVGTKYLNDPQVTTLKKIFFDPQVQTYLKTTTDPKLHDQLSTVSAN
jgi:ABC-type metal ion transport system substrate-binding protein